MAEIIVERAVSRNIPISSKKVEPVIALIRGDNVDLAMQKLKLINKKAAHYIYKTLQSAVANAANNKRLDPKGMKVLKAWVTKGPKYKRYRAGGRGIAKPYIKHRANIFIEIGYGA